MALLDFLFGGGGSDDYGRAAQELRSVPLPILKEYYPELYKQVASLNPEMESAVDLGPSEMAGISTDPALRQAQLKALGKLSEIGDAGGRDAQFMADANRLQSDVDSSVRGREGAIQQNLAARGLSGGMSELVQRNLAAQEGANRQAQMGMDLKAQAEQRALQALMQSGQLAGQMQGQDFSQAAQKAQAADAISRFNAQNLQGVQSRNVANRNNAQQWNATNAQNVASQNVGTRNEAQQYNNNLPQQNFNNQMARAGGIANQYNQSGQAKDRDRASNQQLIGGLISAGGAFAAGGGFGKAGAPQGSVNWSAVDEDKWGNLA